jgi:hypothetical protein
MGSEPGTRPRRQAGGSALGAAGQPAATRVLVPVPFHCSARVTCVALLLYAPTAMQTVTVGQATPFWSRPNAPMGVGVAWMRHEVPSHRSARVSGPELVKYTPTAVQALAVHATLPKTTCAIPGGLGVGCTCHRVPFHRSARIVTGLASPTAVHAVDEVQATPLRKLPRPVGLNVGTICQFLPFHRSARVPSPLKELSNLPPTAMQADDEVQATVDSWMNGAELAGLGVA